MDGRRVRWEHFPDPAGHSCIVHQHLQQACHALSRVGAKKFADKVATVQPILQAQHLAHTDIGASAIKVNAAVEAQALTQVTTDLEWINNSRCCWGFSILQKFNPGADEPVSKLGREGTTIDRESSCQQHISR